MQSREKWLEKQLNYQQNQIRSSWKSQHSQSDHKNNMLYIFGRGEEFAKTYKQNRKQNREDDFIDFVKKASVPK